VLARDNKFVRQPIRITTPLSSPTTLLSVSGACSLWSSWGGWTECSRSCGPGTKRRERTCSTEAAIRSGPVPACSGDRTQDRDCELQPCAGQTTLSFIFGQKEDFNQQVYCNNLYCLQVFVKIWLQFYNDTKCCRQKGMTYGT